jgi:hypothetical protein
LRLSPSGNSESDNCACLIFHLAPQQGSGTIPVLTSCLPDVRPCKTKASSRYTQPAGGFLFRALPVSGWIWRRRPIGDEQRLLPRVQLARETGPAAATAKPEARAASNSERSRSFSCRRHCKTAWLKPQIWCQWQGREGAGNHKAGGTKFSVLAGFHFSGRI